MKPAAWLQVALLVGAAAAVAVVCSTAFGSGGTEEAYISASVTPASSVRCNRIRLPAHFYNDTTSPYNPAAMRHPSTGVWYLLHTFDEVRRPSTRAAPALQLPRWALHPLLRVAAAASCTRVREQAACRLPCCRRPHERHAQVSFTLSDMVRNGTNLAQLLNTHALLLKLPRLEKPGLQSGSPRELAMLEYDESYLAAARAAGSAFYKCGDWRCAPEVGRRRRSLTIKLHSRQDVGTEEHSHWRLSSHPRAGPLRGAAASTWRTGSITRAARSAWPCPRSTRRPGSCACSTC